jgi:hypothetical protein
MTEVRTRNRWAARVALAAALIAAPPALARTDAAWSKDEASKQQSEAMMPSTPSYRVGGRLSGGKPRPLHLPLEILAAMAAAGGGAAVLLTRNSDSPASPGS